MSDTVQPDRWERTTIEDLVESGSPIIYGILQPGDDIAPNGVPYVRPTEIQGDRIILDQLRHTTEEIAERYRRASLRRGDVLISIVGTIGKVAIVPSELEGANITQSPARVRVDPRLTSPEFMAWMLRSPQLRKQYDKVRLGTGVPRLNIAHVRALDSGLPPLNEQRRIVEKIDALFAHSKKANESLDRIPALLEKLKKSILAAAFRGDLTKDWREAHPDVEPADKLLERIRAERRRRWEEAELAKMHAKGKEPSNDKWKAKYEEPVEFGSKTAGLPSGWAWATIDQLAESVEYGTSAKTDDNDSGVPVIRMGNIQDGELVMDNVRYLPPEHEDFPGQLLHDGEVLFNRTNSPELVGKSTVYRGAPSPCAAASYIIHVRLIGVVPELVAHYLNSPMGRAWIRSAISQQVGQANVNGSKLKALAIPVPPLAEQRRIVDLLGRVLSSARRHLNTGSLARQRLERLNQSLLAKAFRGELVSQDPDDEPASVLLERIRAEREAYIATSATPNGKESRRVKSNGRAAKKGAKARPRTLEERSRRKRHARPTS